MGNCLGSSEKLTAEIVPHGGATAYPTVRLHGSPNSIVAAYIGFANLPNTIPPEVVPTTGPSPEPPSSTARVGRSAWIRPVTQQVGAGAEWGSRDALVQFIDARFPDLSASGGGGEEGTMTASLMGRVTRLQHKSMTWHVERMVRWGEDLATRGGRKAVDPKVGSWRMEMRKFGKSYSEVLEVMMEHARMEETVLFPILDAADRGT